MTRPRVSIIIPCFNGASYLGQAIGSVLDQSFQDWELIVVDDGSTDGSRAVAAAFSDSRIRYTYQPNRGLAAARNAGLSLTGGELVTFLDADDLFLPDKLARQVGELSAAPEIGLVAGGHLEIDETGKVLNQVRSWQLGHTLSLSDWLFGCAFAVHSVMVRRSWLRAVGSFDATLRRLEDWDLWLRLALAGCPMTWTPAIVCAYRFHGANMTRQVAEQKQATLAVLDKLFSRKDLPAAVAAQRDQAFAEAWVRGACREYGAGQVEAGKESLRQALALVPQLASAGRDHLFDLLLGWAEHPVTGGDARAYIQRVFSNLPDLGINLTVRQATARWEIGRLFGAYRAGERAMVRRAFLRAIGRDPSWLRNRGVLSIALRSFAPDLSAWVRKRGGADAPQQRRQV